MTAMHRATLASFALFATMGCDASVANPSDASSDGAHEDASADAGIVDCGVADNDPRCPPAVPGVAAAYGSGVNPCSPIGLTCSYPNMGDCCLIDGCFFTAELWCAGDAGEDSGHWFGAQ